jgi:hypothetical protein
VTVSELQHDLPQEQKDLYDHVVHVLNRHLELTRQNPMTGDLIEETVQSFEALDALVAPLRVPQYDLETADGRLMDAVARLNQQIPGVALRTLWHVFEYLSTSDDDGIETRQTALGIIQNLGLPAEDSGPAWESVVKIFPPLP